MRKRGKVLTAQVISETLETLPPTARILVAARYLDGYDSDELSKILQMSRNEICEELRSVRSYIWSQCLDYQNRNKCQLEALNEDIFKEAFELLLKQYLNKTIFNQDGTYI